MLERIKRPLARLGANFIDGIWRMGVMARFFALVLASSGTSFSRFRLVMREVYFTGVLSLVIIIVSGLFIGMVLGLQGPGLAWVAPLGLRFPRLSCRSLSRFHFCSLLTDY